MNARVGPFTALGRRFGSPWGILLLAAVLRLGFVITMGRHYFYADTLEYESVALRLLHGLGLGTSPRAPLFPLEMALGFKLGGEHNYLAVRMVQVLLGTALVAVVMRIAGRLGGPATARWAGLGVALTPTLVFVTGMLYPTTLYALLLALAVATALELAERPGFGRASLLGLLLPLGWLTDPVMVAPAAGIVGWLALSTRRAGKTLVLPLLLVVAIAAAIAVPYTRYQREASGGKTVFMQKAQYVLHYSRSDSLLSSTRRIRLPRGAPYQPLPMVSFLRREARLFEREPGGYLHDVGFEFLHFFRPLPDRIQTQNQYNRMPVLVVGALSFLPVLLLWIVGLVRGRGPLAARLLLGTVVVATGLFYSLFFTQTRYRVPVEPEMIILAALGLVRWLPRKAEGNPEGGTVARP